MALVVIATRTAGNMDRGDVVGVYPDGHELGRRVRARDGLAVIRVRNEDGRRLHHLVEEDNETITLDQVLAEKRMTISPRDRVALQAHLDANPHLLVRGRGKYRRMKLELSLMDEARRERMEADNDDRPDFDLSEVEDIVRAKRVAGVRIRAR